MKRTAAKKAKVAMKDLKPKADSQVKGGKKGININHNETLLRGV